ncbi:PBSX family phage terminase large subunit [Paenibacillus taichungensis]|uniref:PBSX family phage terminase large subunit n=1 Tax=Paenibacillus taichungensis TaxID=484184 RepID=UPI0038279249
MSEVSLQQTIGKGYVDFWRFQGRYRVVKGGRGSKKSVTSAYWVIYNMMKMPLANTLVLRKTFNTHKDSTWAQLKWAAQRLKVSHLWQFKKSPLEAIYKPTGQKILFRGLDDPMSITSITVDTGYLCWAWFEEAYQIMNEDDFDKVDMSIRGELPEGYFKQLTLSFNPWNEKHWLKKRFFDVPDPNVLAITTNYRCNEFLGDDDRALFAWMKEHKPKRHRVEGDGDWGIAEGAVYEDWREEDFNYQDIAKSKGYKAVFGLDFGYTNDPSALVCALVNKDEKKIYIFDEHYEHGMLNNDIARVIKEKGYSKERIIADSSEPKSIDEIRGYGIGRIKGADKGRDSVDVGIQFIKQFEIIVHKFKCPNVSIELSSYVWDQNKSGKFLNRPVDDFNHTMDALRYAMEQIRKPSTFEF